MRCTAGTATSVGTAATLYCMLCIAGTATCMGTAAALYCVLCTAGITNMQGYCRLILYAPHMMLLYNCMLCTQCD